MLWDFQDISVGIAVRTKVLVKRRGFDRQWEGWAECAYALIKSIWCKIDDGILTYYMFKRGFWKNGTVWLLLNNIHADNWLNKVTCSFLDWFSNIEFYACCVQSSLFRECIQWFIPRIYRSGSGPWKEWFLFRTLAGIYSRAQLINTRLSLNEFFRTQYWK